jgi:hypothetical protein
MQTSNPTVASKHAQHVQTAQDSSFSFNSRSSEQVPERRSSPWRKRIVWLLDRFRNLLCAATYQAATHQNEAKSDSQEHRERSKPCADHVQAKVQTPSFQHPLSSPFERAAAARVIVSSVCRVGGRWWRVCGSSAADAGPAHPSLPARRDTHGRLRIRRPDHHAAGGPRH